MKSIDKLREWSCRTDLHEIADEIEAEIAEHYMELPVDADGVPIHVGDEMVDSKTSRTVVAVAPESFMMDGYETGSFYRPGLAKNYRHVKPRTLEDVLEDYVVEYQTRHARSESGAEHFDHVDVHEMVKRCADEIRELMGGDV
jgi:hypothetical protein